jgi:hypothetical protein
VVPVQRHRHVPDLLGHQVKLRTCAFVDANELILSGEIQLINKQTNSRFVLYMSRSRFLFNLYSSEF